MQAYNPKQRLNVLSLRTFERAHESSSLGIPILKSMLNHYIQINDIVPPLLSLMDLPISSYMDGRVLKEIVLKDYSFSLHQDSDCQKLVYGLAVVGDMGFQMHSKVMFFLAAGVRIG